MQWGREGPQELWWAELLAVGALSGDLSVAGIARYSGGRVEVVEQALAEARCAGLIESDCWCDPEVCSEFSAAIPKDRAARIHAEVARHLFAGGPERFVEAMAHARAAGSSVAVEEMVAMADQGGRMSLQLGDYSSACELFAYADEFDQGDDLRAQGARLCHLAEALDGLGRVTEARRHLGRAVTLGTMAGDASLVARAAAQHALPADWYLGDARSIGLLQQAESMNLSHEDGVRILAARAFVEHHVPVGEQQDLQIAWVARSGVAQGYAERALAGLDECGPEVRVLVLMAWRTTHRAPEFLELRRARSEEALDLAQELHNPSLQVEAAIMLAVDALEAGDRPLFDRALAVAQWVSVHDRNPRLRWRALTLAAGAAFLDGDLDEARRCFESASEAGRSVDHPGWFGAHLLFLGQLAIDRRDLSAMRPFLEDESFVGLSHAVGRACVGLGLALLGDADGAAHHAWRAVRQLEPESSMLLVGTRLSAIAVEIDAPALQSELLRILQPWEGHVAVDAHGWWCDGPVSYWIAALHHALGQDERAVPPLRAAEQRARALNDVRTLKRIQVLRELLRVSVASEGIELTDRERRVLLGLVRGATYAAIGRELAYSVSTVRDDSVSIYRKLGVRGRVEAIRRASELGLLD